MDDYLIQLNDLKGLTIQHFIDRLKQTGGRKLQNLRIQDLTFHNSMPIYPGHGAYIFRKNREVIYVGKASSMSFIERVPKHLDFRLNSWFNNLLKIINDKILHTEWNYENAKSASGYAYNNLNVVLINFENNFDKIKCLEDRLISVLEPLNGACYLKNIQLNRDSILIDFS